MIKTAVILAAGFGSRMGDLTKESPKGFLKIDNKSLIKRSMESLQRGGVNKILIGTGHLSEHYDRLSAEYPQLVTCIKNDRYAISSSMDTLYNLSDRIKEDFFLLESDLLYEDRAITALQRACQKNIVLASGRTFSKDEVFITADINGRLISMTKDPSAASTAFGELVGISKVSLKTLSKMCASFVAKGQLDIDYEYVMADVLHPDNFMVHKIDDLAWCEVDDIHHLKRAKSKIIKSITKANNRHYRLLQ
jgi:2-aminoethylphosphonate-pyruvate transaminase